MFTMWAALPGPLILSADLRASAMNTGAGLDSDVLQILTNKAVIAVNQDVTPQGMPVVANDSTVWARKLTSGAVAAIESMSEHLLQLMIANARSVNSYTRTQSFGASSAKAATMLTLPGKMKRSACAAGSDAVAKYKASSAAAKAVASN